jgi:hypothetical protein
VLGERDKANAARCLTDNPTAPAFVAYWHLADNPTAPAFVPIKELRPNLRRTTRCYYDNLIRRGGLVAVTDSFFTLSGHPEWIRMPH